ncbi:helix-turn-helix transcriptional regulator [Conexibacter stalactiti]|uniref:Helix-turn-helix transcriptional regulator n=1 Tax=Conexibacter stalactiti TaxID=1940611 RepID=A0ABU4HVZ1_9ACTN|nr:helix-turn-helix transcriptional regulator [Conexibacter stalactiti]MDW5597496.1 helix-turn-helix transcriptional regulator [Conexibacter stalactiti]MEC5038138.1 helix-turn-helix transcriptional regulator [Conexibacter stalactiti]
MKTSLRSPVNYAVLGLVIEKPSYGYELLQRLRARYGELLEVNSPSHVYAALDRLQRERLIVHNTEAADPAEDERPVRQPKVTYRATADGAVVYRQWLAERLRDDEERIELLGRLIAVGARDLGALGDLIDRYDAECVSVSQRIPLVDRSAAQAGVEPEREFVQRLVAEERRFVLEAQLRWIDYAREELRDRAAHRDGSAGGR